MRTELTTPSWPSPIKINEPITTIIANKSIGLILSISLLNAFIVDSIALQNNG